VRVAAEIGVREVYLQRLVFFDNDAIGLARPDQALYEQIKAHLDAATEVAQAYGIVFGASGAASELGMSLERARLALDAVPAALDGDVFHRQWSGAAVLNRSILAPRLRVLNIGRRHPADAAGDLERRGLPLVPGGAAV
jgi:hypothetical protein